MWYERVCQSEHRDERDDVEAAVDDDGGDGRRTGFPCTTRKPFRAQDVARTPWEDIVEGHCAHDPLGKTDKRYPRSNRNDAPPIGLNEVDDCHDGNGEQQGSDTGTSE
jgi:hypothetical protein